jgi:hypothetical protein
MNANFYYNHAAGFLQLAAFCDHRLSVVTTVSPPTPKEIIAFAP